MKEHSLRNKDLQDLLHPFAFILKEGEDIDNNFLDYSLLMLKVSHPEVIRSPGSDKVMRFLQAALALKAKTLSDTGKNFASDQV